MLLFSCLRRSRWSRSGIRGPVHFKLAHVITAGTPIDVGANKFAELVKQRTNGEIEIKVFPAGQLGGERAIIEGVQLGTIEMSFTTTGAWRFRPNSRSSTSVPLPSTSRPTPT
jgi:TRAP-type C4-dicarboxylate transport system substrate-binding protein